MATTGWLRGWRLTFGGEEHGWDGALSTIVEDPLEQVFVAVYDVTREDEASPRRLGGRGPRALPQDRVRVSTLTGELVVWTSRPRRLRGRIALPRRTWASLADAAEARGRPGRLRGRAPHAALPVDRAVGSARVHLGTTRDYSGETVWQTASTLLPSGSRTKAP